MKFRGVSTYIYIYPYENIQINPYAPVYLYRRKCRQRDIHDKH